MFEDDYLVTTDLREAVFDADFIIECITENLMAKQELYERRTLKALILIIIIVGYRGGAINKSQRHCHYCQYDTISNRPSLILSRPPGEEPSYFSVSLS
jgi:hypothetical protein